MKRQDRVNQRRHSRYRLVIAAVVTSALHTSPCLANNRVHIKVTKSSPARFTGPYALSVRDSVNDLLIRSQLAQLGISLAQGEPLDTTTAVQSLPAVMPTDGHISSGFGYRASPFSGRRKHHNGLDIAVAHGSPVRATADGVVIGAGWQRYLGNTITIDHGHGVETRYGHNSKLTVRVGDTVRRGDVVARAGSTGRSTGPHVHYEVWVNNRRQDPNNFMFDLPTTSSNSTLVASAGPFGATSKKYAANVPALGVGGDEDDTAEILTLRSQVPSPKQRLVINAATLLAMALGMLAMLSAQLPKAVPARASRKDSVRRA